MREFTDPVLAETVLTDPRFVVPPVCPAASGIGWLRASVGRFSSGTTHTRRRAAYLAALAGIPPDELRAHADAHPVAVLACAMGIREAVADLVREVARAYQPGSGDDERADRAVEQLVGVFGGRRDEETAARIGVLVQACDATAALVERARHRPVADVLRDDPPVAATRRQALVRATVGDLTVEAGEVVRVRLAGDLAFGAGPHRCPGRAHALALVAGAPG